jgi:flagellin
MLTIQTNVASLIAQENLRVNSEFQTKTIQQLTSGYRINQSGDDAAGLAVANKFRNNIAELTQGVANGNDGVAQLQIMDGGMSNISSILDRLKTLAMQSASDSFTGSRSTLNSEFQTDIAEIDRQAQSIGLNTSGVFAKSLAVYLGAGSGSLNTTNSVVTVDLSKATVDSQSLGLTGVQAVNLAPNVVNDYDLGSASATSVSAILGANAAPTKYTFRGPGFGDANGIQISVNTSGVSDTASLVAAVNTAIQAAANQQGGNYAALKAANITASIHTDSAGKQQLAFTSSGTAFQVTADTTTANAFMGHFAGAPTGAAGDSAGSSWLALGAYELGTAGANGNPNTETDVAFVAGAAGTQAVTISANDANGVAHNLTVNFDSTNGPNRADTMAHALAALNTALQSSNDATLKQITAVADPTGVSLNFVSTLPQFSVAITADSADPTKGIMAHNASSALKVGSGGVADISTVDGAQAAVTAITGAVGTLGAAQAAIGKSQNQLTYAINLAQSQITNFSSAEAQIRDADIAQEAANLTKAQVLQQASIAAMAQANSAPQAVLSLLKG